MKRAAGVWVFAWLSASNVAMAAGETICLDAGHGGNDPGGTGCDLEEAAIVLDVVERLQPLLEAAGFEVIQTRTTDVFVELGTRTDYANAQGADRFASMHANAFGDPSANGTETFCHTSGGTSIDMRDRIQTEMIAAWGLTDRGPKTANFFVLANTNMAATLSELGFVTNCDVDAPVLRSADRRQEAAQAHLNAIAAHLGVDPGEPPQTGRLLGTVAEDQGVGLADLTVRIPGASVALVGENQTTTTMGADSLWQFTLDAGTYTVRASAAGYVTGERTCTVTAGTDTYCSVALLPTGQGEGEGEGNAGEGEGEGDGIGEGEGEGNGNGEGEGEGNAAEGEGDTAEGESDGEGEGESTGPDVERVIIRNTGGSPSASGGCDCGGSQAALALSFLALLGGRKRIYRRRHAPLLGAAMVMWVGAAAHAQSTSADVKLTSETPSSAVLSPDGTHLLVSDIHHRGLAVMDVASGRTTQISEQKGAGFRAQWLDNHIVAHRASKPFRGEPLLTLQARAVSGRPAVGTWVGPAYEHPTHVVRQIDDVIYLSKRTSESEPQVVRKGVDVAISPAGARCFAPMLHRTGVVLFQCMTEGVLLHRMSDGQLLSLGRGDHPTWSYDGSHVAFIRADDEGHRIVRADVVVADVRGKQPVVQVLRTDVVERGPSLNADGTLLTYITEDGVFARRMERVQP
jgi:N-acetylmuramoyl-L-alanine amidase